MRFRLPLSDHQFIAAVFTDYALALDELEKAKRKLEQEKRCFQGQNVRLRKLFGFSVTASKEISGVRRCKFQRIISTQNTSFHAAYDDDECQKLIRICESPGNASFMESEELTVADAHKLMEDLEYMKKVTFLMKPAYSQTFIFFTFCS